MTIDSLAETARRKNRWTLLGIVALFVGPILLAGMLTWSGWRPAGTKAYGTLIDPPYDVNGVPVALADGAKFVWRNPQWQWTLLALPGPTCAQACRIALGDVLRMRATLGRNAERLRVLYLGPALAPDALATLVPLQQGVEATNEFAGWRPKDDDTLALVLVDPNGLLMMIYPAGYDIAGVRRDLPKVVN